MKASMMWHCLNEIMQEAITSFVPCRPAVTSKSKPLWMTTKVLRNVKKKHKLRKKWRASAHDNAEQRKIAKNIKRDSKSRNYRQNLATVTHCGRKAEYSTRCHELTKLCMSGSSTSRSVTD